VTELRGSFCGNGRWWWFYKLQADFYLLALSLLWISKVVVRYLSTDKPQDRSVPSLGRTICVQPRGQGVLAPLCSL